MTRRSCALRSAHDPQRARVAPDPQRAAAHDLEKLRPPREIGREAVDLRLARGELHDEAVGRRIEHAATGAYDIAADGIGVRWPDPQLQQDELPLEMLARRHVL